MGVNLPVDPRISLDLFHSFLSPHYVTDGDCYERKNVGYESSVVVGRWG